MRALVYTGPNSLAYRDEPAPEMRDGEEVVRVSAVGICGSDMHAYHGHDSRRPAPLILGHEAAGTVVGGAMAGRRVTIDPLVIDYACPMAQAGRPHLSPTRQILSMPPRQGGFAEFVRIPARNLVAIPDALGFEKAALAEPLAVSWHAVMQGVRLLGGTLAGGRVAVLGGGAIGLGAALVAATLGPASIAVGETNAARGATVTRSGDFLAYAPGSASEPADNTIDLVIDAVGAAATRAAASRMIRPGGVIVHAGLLPGHDGLDIRKITLQEIVVSGTYCYTHADFEATVAAIADGRLGALDWFESRPLAEGAQAFADIDAGRIAAAKVMLIP